MPNLKPNVPAPPFELLNHAMETYQTADFLGQWLILYFYPKDNTPGCTNEAVDFSHLLPEFMKLGATVVGISPDSIVSHGKFIAKHQLQLILLSDPEHQVAEAYGIWQLKKFMGKEYMGIVRSTFAINPQGNIAKIWSPVKVKGHAAGVLDWLTSQP